LILPLKKSYSGDIIIFAPDRNRSDVGFHYHGEVNELLVQMNDALDKGIIVIVATDYANRLDPTVKRPGRIDKVHVI
jgi:ATP-dependent Zn protease